MYHEFAYKSQKLLGAAYYFAYKVFNFTI